MHPPDDVIVIIFLAHSRKVRGKISAYRLVAHAYDGAVDRMAAQTAKRLKQFFAMTGVALRLRGRLDIERRLPEERGDGLDFVIVEPEGRHLGSGAKCLRVRKPYGYPLFAQLRTDFFQIGTDFLLVLHPLF